jgi:hypothetical protein
LYRHWPTIRKKALNMGNRLLHLMKRRGIIRQRQMRYLDLVSGEQIKRQGIFMQTHQGFHALLSQESNVLL